MHHETKVQIVEAWIDSRPRGTKICSSACCLAVSSWKWILNITSMLLPRPEVQILIKAVSHSCKKGIM